MQTSSTLFDWAKPAAQSETMKEGQSDVDSDDDPIGQLLKSNTAVFGVKKDVLKSGILSFNKLKNATSDQNKHK